MTELPEWIQEAKDRADKDAEFITAARTDVPRLIEMVSEMAALLPDILDYIQDSRADDICVVCRPERCPCSDPVECLARDVLRVQRMYCKGVGKR